MKNKDFLFCLHLKKGFLWLRGMRPSPSGPTTCRGNHEGPVQRGSGSGQRWRPRRPDLRVLRPALGKWNVSSWMPPSGGVPGTFQQEEDQGTTQDRLCLSAGLGPPEYDE
ncbi:hypothetical protein ILYODFUR_037745 [Ilyodon furcidens]|uniref:Uncharacterized protein n=1 Tax=Ilyodon furcidens TaxID=33524 RepID=A0ABV0UMC7_9TELE